MQRRQLLTSVSSFALAALVPETWATGAFAQGLAAGLRGFRGDPNARFTSIDSAGGIVMSRSAGQLPAFVHVSASAILASGSVLDGLGNPISQASLRPYERLEYHWDFGDPTGTEIFTDPQTTSLVNANSSQYGPEAAYVYRKAGAYTITLNIRGIASDGAGYLAARAQANFTATTFNNKGGNWYFDSESGNDTNHGRSPSSPRQTLKAIQRVIGAANTAIHLAYGSSWTSNNPLLLFHAAQSLRIDAYGAPATGKPKLICTGGNEGAIVFFNMHGYRDVVLSNLDVQLTTTATKANAPIVMLRGPGVPRSDIYVDNCDCTCSVPRVGAWFAVSHNKNEKKANDTNMSLWGGSYTQDAGGAFGIAFGAAEYMSYVGVAVKAVGPGGGNVFVHFINPATSCNHCLCRWSSTSGSGMNFCIQPRCENWSGDLVGGNWLVADNHFADGMNGINFGNQLNTNPSVTSGDLAGYFDGVVVERNSFSSVLHTVFWLSGVTNITIRDNKIWKFGYAGLSPHPGVAGRPPTASGIGLSQWFNGCFYRNLIHRDDSMLSNDVPIITLFTEPGNNCTQPQEITDNIIYDARSGRNAVITAMIFADQLSSLSVFARNHYYAPNANGAPAGSYFRNGPASQTLAQFQAASPLYFDSNATYDNPNWVDPANGNFNLTKAAVEP